MSSDPEVHKRTGVQDLEMESEAPDEKMSGFRLEFTHGDQRSKLMWKTHANVMLYSCCFWIQLGVLPVIFVIFCTVNTRHKATRLMICMLRRGKPKAGEYSVF